MIVALERLFLKIRILSHGPSRASFLLLMVLALILSAETLRSFSGPSAVLGFYLLSLLLMITYIFNFSSRSLIITALFSLSFCVIFLALGATFLADQLSSLSYVFLAVLVLKQFVTLVRMAGG